MGDLVLTEDEVNPVMAKLLAGGIEVTALHNHLLRNQPVHDVHARAGARRSGQAGDACCTTRSPKARRRWGRRVAPATAPPAIDLDTAALDRTLGAKGTNNGGIYQFGIPRAEPVQDADMVVPASMGLANAINFQPTRRRQGGDHRRLRFDRQGSRAGDESVA